MAAAIRKTDLRTKKYVVDLALRRLVGPPLTREFRLELEGLGWSGDPDDMRSSSSAPTL